MNDEKLLYFLNQLNKSKNVYALVYIYKMKYVEINEYYKYSIDEGYIKMTNGSPLITKLGITKLRELRKKLSLKGNSNFIVPYKKVEFEGISTETVYFPKKR